MQRVKTIAVLTIAYNEEQYIGACIKQFKGLINKHLVLLSTKPWNGQAYNKDRTEQIARSLSAEVIMQFWQTEHEQRNWGLAYLYNYDYVFIVDADEMYSKLDIEKILETLYNKQEPCFRISNIKTYWKTKDYIIYPADTHEPVIIVNPKMVKFKQHRNLQQIQDSVYQQDIPVIEEVIMHHYSYAKSDMKIKEKIQSFSHCNEMDKNWYENTWKKWQPDKKTFLRLYNNQESIAIKD